MIASERSIPEHVGRAVDQPRRVIRNREPDEYPPDHPRPAAERKEPKTERDLQRHVSTAARDKTDRRRGRLRNVAISSSKAARHCAGRSSPRGPLQALDDAMRIAFMIGVRVVLAVHRDPSDGIALQCQRSKNRQHVFERLAQSKTAVCEKSMKAERNAQRGRAVPQDARGRDRRPAKKAGPTRGKRSHVNAEQTERFNASIQLVQTERKSHGLRDLGSLSTHSGSPSLADI